MSKQTLLFSSVFHCDVLLVTGTSVETRAILATFQHATNQLATIQVFQQKTYYDLHQLADARIFLVQSDMGSRGSAMTVLSGILALKPTIVIMVGIAFGLHPGPQQLGDILVSRHLRDYEAQRVSKEPDGTMRMLARGERPRASDWLLDRCQAALQTWNGPKAHMGLLLSGEKLVDHPDFLAQLRTFEPEAIGGEMEAMGLYAAAHHTQVDWLVVKAISDWADGRKGEQKEEHQLQAATNAARFVVHLLRQKNMIKRQMVRLTWSKKTSTPLKTYHFWLSLRIVAVLLSLLSILMIALYPPFRQFLHEYWPIRPADIHIQRQVLVENEKRHEATTGAPNSHTGAV